MLLHVYTSRTLYCRKLNTIDHYRFKERNLNISSILFALCGIAQLLHKNTFINTWFDFSIYWTVYLILVGNSTWHLFLKDCNCQAFLIHC